MDVIYKPFALEAKAVDGDATLRKMSFTISAGSLDRDGDTIDPNGWDLEAYKRNPVVLWHHDTTIPPVAKSERVWVEDGRLKAVAVFPPKGVHPFADTIHDLVEGGWLNAASVGFRPVEKGPSEKGVAYRKQELYEWSILPVPSNKDALREAKAAGIDVEPVLKWATEFLAKNGDDAIRKALAEAVPAPPPDPGATTGSGDHAGAGAVSKMIREEGGKFCVFSADGTKKLGCHDTREEAQAQLAAIEASKHERSPAQWRAIVDGWLSLEPTITPEQLEVVCPSCAKAMREKGIASFRFRKGMSFKEFPGGMSAQSLAGLCDKFGADEGFFTRCSESSLSGTMDNVEGFCADLHQYCIGKWPGERAAFVVSVKQPVEMVEPERTPRLVSEILAEQAAREEQWQLESALYESIRTIMEFAPPEERPKLLQQTVGEFLTQYDARKEADEMNRLAKELFGDVVAKQDPPPPPAPGAPPADGTPAPEPAEDEDEDEDGSGIAEVDDAYEKLWADVKAALEETDPTAKANALKAALEAFAVVVMEAKPAAPPAAPAPTPGAPPPGGETMVAMRADLDSLVAKVGRVLSGKNEARVRAALAALSEIIDGLPQEPEAAIPVDGDTTTPERNGEKRLDLTDAEVKALGEKEEDDLEKLLATELGMGRADVAAAVGNAVKEAFRQARTGYDGRLPD